MHSKMIALAAFLLAAFGLANHPVSAAATVADDSDLLHANGLVNVVEGTGGAVRITQSGGGTAVSESGTTDTYTIVLDSQPSATVNVAITFPATDLTVDGDTDGTYNTTFTTANWNIPRTITVAAVNDRNFEADHTGALVHAFTSADPIYNGITAQVDGTIATNTLTASITDNETLELRWVNATGSGTEGEFYLQNVVMDITADPAGGTPQNEVEISFEAPITFVTAEAADIQILFIAQTISAGNSDGQQYSVFHDVVDDALVEGPETFSMAIDVTTPYPGLTVGADHVATIPEGSTATASIATTSLAFGEDIGTFSIPVTLNVSPNAALGEPATVVVQLDDGTAAFNGAVGDMYFDNGGTPVSSIVVTFPAGSDNGDVVNAVVTLRDDQTAESSPASPAPFNVNEQFGVTLGATTGVLSAATGTTTVVIEENDFAYITVDAPTITVDESDGIITQNLRVRMATFGTGPQQLQAAATVPLENQTFGSAAAPDDYTLITPSVTIPAGALNNSLHPFQVSIVDDDIDEGGDEFGDVGIVNGSYSGVPIIVPPSANNNCDTTVNPGLTPPSPCRNRMTMRILENDTAAIIVTESGGTTAVTEGSTTDSYTVVLGSQPAADVTINIAFDPAQLVVNGDSDGTTSLTFTSANWDTVRTVNVVAVDDTVVEANPHSATIVQTASSTDPQYSVINPADVLASITENDLQEITFAAAGSTTAENGTHVVNARLSIISNGTPGGTITSDMTANVNVALGSAEAGDVTLITTSVTFPAGSAHNSTLPIDIDITDDRILEGDEDVTLGFTLVTAIGTVSGTHDVTVVDNETANLAFTTLSQNFAESVGNAATPVELVITGSGTVGATFTTENAVTVQITDAPGTAANPADYTLTTTSLTFPAGTVSGTALDVTTAIVSDLVYEIDENYTLGFGTIAAIGTVTSSIAHTATIVDDETVSFVIAPAAIPVAESAGTHTSTVAMTVTGTGTGTTSIQNAIVIPILYTEVTANEPEDFAVGAGSVSFAASAASGATQTITVGIVDDEIDEADETFSINLDTSTAAPDIIFGNASTVVTIVDNDMAAIIVTESAGSTDVTEGGAQDSYTVVLASQPTSDVTVQLGYDTQVELSADGVTFNPAPVILTYTPANWNTARTIAVQAVNDTRVEGPHTTLIEQTVSSGDALYNVLDPADVSVDLTDNDTAEVIFSSAGFAAVEGAVFSPGMTLKVTANGAPGGSIAAAVVVDLGVTPLTASADDVSITTAQATFPAGSTHDTVVMTHSATVVDDPVVEGVEDFGLDLGIASGLATTTASNTYTITDNDSATVSFAPVSVNQSEAITPMTFTVTLSNPVASGVTVTVNSTNGSASAADFTAISGGSVTFPPDSTAPQTVNVSINNDALDEDDEQFTLTLSNPVATGAVTLGTATATGTIEDDDALPVLSVVDVSQPEGDAVNTLIFTVNLSAVSGRDVSFTRATADGTAISTGPDADFVAVAAGPITIPAGETSVTIPVTINGDTTFEDDESFGLTLTAVNNASPGALGATATLQNDDEETTTTEITSDAPDPSAVNAPYTVQVTVRGQTLAPAGTVTVDDGSGASCGPVTLVAGTPPASSASCEITSTTPGTRTLTATYTPASPAFAASSDTEPHTVVVVAPEIAYAAAPGTTVEFTGVSTIGTTGSSTIVATPSGGAGTGAAATTTIDSCSLGGSNPASFAGAGAIGLSFVGDTATPQTLALTCSAAATIQTATLTCNETRGDETPMLRAWPLSCPAGALLPLTSTPATGATVQITGVATTAITLTNPNPIEVSLSCTPPALPFTASPLAFSIPAGGSAAVDVGIGPTDAGNYAGTLSCTVAGSPQVFTFNLAGELAGALVPPTTISATSVWSLIVLMLAMFGIAAAGWHRRL